MLASQKGHKQIVTLLISFNADLNCMDNNGLTPLHIGWLILISLS